MTTILLLDDHGLVRAGIKALLDAIDANSTVSEAGSFDKAVELLDQTAFDIALVDIDLRGEKTGLDFLGYVRERDLPVQVIMLSADDDRSTVLNCISAGAAGYIPKGADDPTVFENALTTVVRGGIYLPRSVIWDDDRRPATLSWPSTGVATTGLPSSPRMREVLYYLCQGLTNKTIARRLDIAEGTVRKSYVSELLRFYRVARRTELIIEISRLGIQVPRPVSGNASDSGPALPPPAVSVDHRGGSSGSSLAARSQRNGGGRL